MNPNQPHTGQFQPTPPQPQWQQPNTPPTAAVAAKQKSGMPVIGAYALAGLGALLGIIAVVIAVSSSGGSTNTTSNAAGATAANKEVCAQIRVANQITIKSGAVRAAAVGSGNKPQEADAVSSFGTATTMMSISSQNASTEVREAVSMWVETVSNWMAGSVQGTDLDAAAKKVEEVACK